MTFAHRWWWGVLTPLDATVAAQDLGVEPDQAACVAELARWDLELISELGAWDGRLETLDATFRMYAEPDLRVPVPEPASTKPQVKHATGWHTGLVEAWDGNVAAHTRLALAERPDAARMRIWAAQIARLMPFIELERSRLAEWFATEVERAGRHPDYVESDIAALEIGPLWACIGAHRHIRIHADRLALVRDLREARNALAHRRPIGRGTVTALRRSADADRYR